MEQTGDFKNKRIANPITNHIGEHSDVYTAIGATTLIGAAAYLSAPAIATTIAKASNALYQFAVFFRF